MTQDDVVQRFCDGYDFELDAFQIEAAETLLDGRSVLVTAPTGSGKTIVAEFAIFDALDRQLQVIYTTPLKALSNQKFRDLQTLYPPERVGLVTGDQSLNPKADVVVMTTEILRNILYQNPQRLDSVLYIVIDECHYMNDMDRGTVWEEIIIHAPSHLCLVALSATIANADELCNWISSIHNEMKIIEHIERPVPLRHFYFGGEKLYPMLNAKGKMNVKLERLARKQREQKRQLHRDRRKGRKSKRPPKISEAQVVEALEEKGMLPAIYFIFSRRNCDESLSGCLEAGLDLTSKAEKKKIKAAIHDLLNTHPSLKETGPSTDNLLRGLPCGIAAHHAGLVPLLRYLVESLFQQNLIRVVFATETLAAGINMPARTTVISSLSKRTDVGHRNLTVNEFTQMTGRAGRRGMDTEGSCVIVGSMYQSPHVAMQLIQGDFDPIESHFSLSYNMVLNLMRFGERKEIRQVLQRSFGQYLSNKEMINLDLLMQKKKQDLEQLKVTPESKSYIRHLRSQLRGLKKQVKRQQEIYLKEFDALTRVLQYFGRLKPDGRHWHLTPLGEMTSHLRAQNDLLISLVLESMDVRDFSPVEIAAILSTMVFEPRRPMEHDLSLVSRKARRFFKEVLYIADDLRYVQEEENIRLSITVEFDFAPLVFLWGTGAKWSTLFEHTEMTDGDMVRSMRQLIDLLRQVEVIPTLPQEFKQKVHEAIPLLDRELIKLVI